MSNIRHHRNPYLKNIFTKILFTWLAVLIISNVSIYFFLDQRTFSFAQESVISIASNVASNVPANLHESITEASQQNSDEYKVIENYFQIVMDANPRVDDVYTLRPTSDSGVATFVVSGMEDEDTDGNGIIEQHEIKPRIGEKYDISNQPELQQAFHSNDPLADSGVTHDKWGSWISGYAPIRDVSGTIVAIVGVDVASKYVSDQRIQIIQSMLLLDAAALPILLIVGYFIARRLTHEFNVLVEGMDQLTHGNINYELPLDYKGTGGVFRILFHDMVGMFKNLKSEAEEKRHEKG